ncbi:O-antigen ligase family protein [Blautia acetigignens]|uniref:O-antigen ligase family protein n=1 Tax=Blautia acetigignens TaxID=2981783 RepID=A0ABV1CQZ2_9FIRM
MIELELEYKSQVVEWIPSIIVGGLILLGTHSNVFSILAFLMIAYIVLFREPEYALKQMVFVLPLANIFKMGPGSQSFFTYIVLLYVIAFIFRLKKMNATVMLFIIYILMLEIVMDAISIPKTFKFVGGLLMLYYVFSEVDLEISHEAVFKRYILGVITASCIARLNSSYFNIARYLSVQELGTRYGYGEMTRFTGLDTDPNYYAVSIIVSLCLIVLLYHRNEIKAVPAVVQAAFLIFFALLTYSKSVFIMLAFPAVFLAVSNHKKKNYILQIILIIFLIGVALYALAGNIQAVNIILTRISVNTNLNGITTGRIELWVAYLQYFGEHIVKAILGSGLGADYAPNVNRAVHNAYIEAVYHLGIVGLVWLIYALRNSYSKYKYAFKRNILNYSVLICVLIMYLFLNELFYYDAPFHFLLAFMAMNTMNDREDRGVKLSDGGV